jgi:hypothetical protein
MPKLPNKIRSSRLKEVAVSQSSGAARHPTSEPEVNLCIKVSGARRRHWASEAKRKGTTMTSVIVDALVREFGEPVA